MHSLKFNPDRLQSFSRRLYITLGPSHLRFTIITQYRYWIHLGLRRRDYKQISSFSVHLKNSWRHTSFPPYAFTAWHQHDHYFPWNSSGRVRNTIPNSMPPMNPCQYDNVKIKFPLQCTLQQYQNSAIMQLSTTNIRQHHKYSQDSVPLLGSILNKSNSHQLYPLHFQMTL